MDSYNFYFERMSNVDLHPLSLPVSRLSSAKSNSSIVDQLAHHQHGKGDSAYSSFSGGSTAPDYPSPFLPDDLHTISVSHYADFKYVKPIYHPSQVLQSDSNTMDQLYCSVEAISQHYNNTVSNVNHLNGNASLHANNKALSKQAVSFGAPSQVVYPPVHPPPVPARLDSFIATKNLENSRVQHGADFQHVDLQPKQPKSHNRLPHLSHVSSTLRAETTKGVSDNSPDSDPGYKNYETAPILTHQQPTQHPPPQPHNQTGKKINPEYLFITDNKSVSEQQRSLGFLSRSSSQGSSQTENSDSMKSSNSGGCNGDHNNKPSSWGSHFESHRKRALSADNCLGSETARVASPWIASQSFLNSSIQHKGQFYFVTGVCRLSESGMRTHSSPVGGSEGGSESSTVVERHQLCEKERSHSTMENFFKPLKESSQTLTDMIPDRAGTQAKDPVSNLDQENHKPSPLSTQFSQSFDSLEEIDMTQSREIGRHTPNNPIFYCGPERNCSPHSALQMKEYSSLISKDEPTSYTREEQRKGRKRQPLTDVASERINKETTPLLYQLTGANRAALQPKKKDFSLKDKGTILNKTDQGRMAGDDHDKPPQDNMMKIDRGESVTVACNTLDDSFKKYYKEKLKDAQSKVLRETSFKRKDLQLSWPNRNRQNIELRPTVIHSFSSSQDSETSTETLTPSVSCAETESIKEEVSENPIEMNKEAEKTTGRPANVAQPQVARINGRKRLTPEQKKMCYSEPEKLNHLGGPPNHSVCRSFGNEGDGLFAVDDQGQERGQQGEQGLVAARRKMFETRGRALSASSASKANLKHLQHKALVEYMERKTGQKTAEPQQPAPQLLPPPRQRHSLGEKPFDWGPRPQSASHEGKNPKKKLHRPHSAGRILDSSTSSIRYAQFFSSQSCSGQYASQSNQPRERESHGPSQGKCASVESLLDQPEPHTFFRNRSTSTPHAFQAHDYEKDPLPVNTMETGSPQKHAKEDTLMKPFPLAQQPVRVVAQRGKSMEELGATKSAKLSTLSKSSEQLDTFWRHSAGPEGSDRDKRSVSFLDGMKEPQNNDRTRKKPYVLNEKGKELEISGLKNTEGHKQTDAQKKSQSDAGPLDSSEAKSSTCFASPASSSASSRARVHSAPPRSSSPVVDEFTSCKSTSAPPSSPPSPNGQEDRASEKEAKSSATAISQMKHLCEMRPSTMGNQSSSPSDPEHEQSVDEPSNDVPLSDSDREVSLSCGVTTDPSLWIDPPEKEVKEDAQEPLLKENVSEGPSSSVPSTETVKTCVSEMEDDKTEKNTEVEEKGTPEVETESVMKPNERPQWEELVEAVVKADQSLSTVFYPLANRKTALKLMEQLLSEDTLLMEEHYKKKQERRGSAESAETVEAAETPPCLKPPDTELHNKDDISEKKDLLVSHIKNHLHSLEETCGSLQAEVQENVAHGEALEALVRERCLPLEVERYNLFIGDLERVVSLLFCLSARLARVQNALSTVDQHTDPEEKESLDSRHRLLCKQREDAKDLKDNLDRRENLVSTFLSRHLSAEQLQGYRRFVQTKASLLIWKRDLEEKQRLGKEQLDALSKSLNL